MRFSEQRFVTVEGIMGRVLVTLVSWGQPLLVSPGLHGLRICSQPICLPLGTQPLNTLRYSHKTHAAVSPPFCLKSSLLGHPSDTVESGGL